MSEEDEYEFIGEQLGQETLVVEDGGRNIFLDNVFELAEEEDMDTREVAEELDIDEEDVENAVKYWNENEEVYERFADDEEFKSTVDGEKMVEEDVKNRLDGALESKDTESFREMVEDEASDHGFEIYEPDTEDIYRGAIELHASREDISGEEVYFGVDYTGTVYIGSSESLVDKEIIDLDAAGDDEGMVRQVVSQEFDAVLLSGYN